jgi:SOS-response transcriptional repressor LexA
MEFISAYFHANGAAPSYREIGAAVGLNSPSSVSRYIVQLKAEGKLVSSNQKGQAFALARMIELHREDNHPQRVRLEVADGGIVLIDCDLVKRNKDVVSVSFSGIIDASQIKSRVGQVVNCRIEES